MCVLLQPFSPVNITETMILVLSLKGAYRTGYAVLGATAISTVALVLW